MVTQNYYFSGGVCPKSIFLDFCDFRKVKKFLEKVPKAQEGQENSKRGFVIPLFDIAAFST